MAEEDFSWLVGAPKTPPPAVPVAQARAEAVEEALPEEDFSWLIGGGAEEVATPSIIPQEAIAPPSSDDPADDFSWLVGDTAGPPIQAPPAEDDFEAPPDPSPFPAQPLSDSELDRAFGLSADAGLSMEGIIPGFSPGATAAESLLPASLSEEVPSTISGDKKGRLKGDDLRREWAKTQYIYKKSITPEKRLEAVGEFVHKWRPELAERAGWSPDGYQEPEGLFWLFDWIDKLGPRPVRSLARSLRELEVQEAASEISGTESPSFDDALKIISKKYVEDKGEPVHGEELLRDALLYFGGSDDPEEILNEEAAKNRGESWADKALDSSAEGLTRFGYEIAKHPIISGALGGAAGLGIFGPLAAAAGGVAGGIGGAYFGAGVDSDVYDTAKEEAVAAGSEGGHFAQGLIALMLFDPLNFISLGKFRGATDSAKDLIEKGMGVTRKGDEAVSAEAISYQRAGRQQFVQELLEEAPESVEAATIGRLSNQLDRAEEALDSATRSVRLREGLSEAAAARGADDLDVFDDVRSASQENAVVAQEAFDSIRQQFDDAVESFTGDLPAVARTAEQAQLIAKSDLQRAAITAFNIGAELRGSFAPALLASLREKAALLGVGTDEAQKAWQAGLRAADDQRLILVGFEDVAGTAIGTMKAKPILKDVGASRVYEMAKRGELGVDARVAAERPQYNALEKIIDKRSGKSFKELSDELTDVSYRPKEGVGRFVDPTYIPRKILESTKGAGELQAIRGEAQKIKRLLGDPKVKGAARSGLKKRLKDLKEMGKQASSKKGLSREFRLLQEERLVDDLNPLSMTITRKILDMAPWLDPPRQFLQTIGRGTLSRTGQRPQFYTKTGPDGKRVLRDKNEMVYPPAHYHVELLEQARHRARSLGKVMWPSIRAKLLTITEDEEMLRVAREFVELGYAAPLKGVKGAEQLVAAITIRELNKVLDRITQEGTRGTVRGKGYQMLSPEETKRAINAIDTLASTHPEMDTSNLRAAIEEYGETTAGILRERENKDLWTPGSDLDNARRNRLNETRLELAMFEGAYNKIVTEKFLIGAELDAAEKAERLRPELERLQSEVHRINELLGSKEVTSEQAMDDLIETLLREAEDMPGVNLNRDELIPIAIPRKPEYLEAAKGLESEALAAHKALLRDQIAERFDEAAANTVMDVMDRWAQIALDQGKVTRKDEWYQQVTGIHTGRGMFDEAVGPDILLSRTGKRAIETPEFKRWFGGSKIVDEAGEPLVVYHGTTATVGGPDFAFRGSKSSGGLIYFDARPEVASEYASGARSGYMDLGSIEDKISRRIFEEENPSLFSNGLLREGIGREELSELLFDVDTFQARELAESLDEGSLNVSEAVKRYNEGDETSASVTPAYLKVEKPYNTRETAIPFLEADQLGADFFRKAGADGVWVKEADGAAIAVFEPTQIKSTQNVGTFDPSDPRILHHTMTEAMGPGMLFHEYEAAPIFYSQLYRSLEKVGVPEKVSLNTLVDNLVSSGVSQSTIDELDLTGWVQRKLDDIGESFDESYRGPPEKQAGIKERSLEKATVRPIDIKNYIESTGHESGDILNRLVGGDVSVKRLREVIRNLGVEVENTGFAELLVDEIKALLGPKKLDEFEDLVANSKYGLADALQSPLVQGITLPREHLLKWVDTFKTQVEDDVLGYFADRGNLGRRLGERRSLLPWKYLAEEVVGRPLLDDDYIGGPSPRLDEYMGANPLGPRDEILDSTTYIPDDTGPIVLEAASDYRIEKLRPNWANRTLEVEIEFSAPSDFGFGSESGYKFVVKREIDPEDFGVSEDVFRKFVKHYGADLERTSQSILGELKKEIPYADASPFNVDLDLTTPGLEKYTAWPIVNTGPTASGVTTAKSKQHFPGLKDIIAHFRFGVRTGPGGKRWLHVEEIQSDTAQGLNKAKRAEGLDSLLDNLAGIGDTGRTLDGTQPLKARLAEGAKGLASDDVSIADDTISWLNEVKASLGNATFKRIVDDTASQEGKPGSTTSTPYIASTLAEAGYDPSAWAEAQYFATEAGSGLSLLLGALENAKGGLREIANAGRHAGISADTKIPYEKGWVDLAIKRLVAFAVDEADEPIHGIAWTTGDVQSNRYLGSAEEALASQYDVAMPARFKRLYGKETGGIEVKDFSFKVSDSVVDELEAAGDVRLSLDRFIEELQGRDTFGPDGFVEDPSGIIWYIYKNLGEEGRRRYGVKDVDFSLKREFILSQAADSLLNSKIAKIPVKDIDFGSEVHGFEITPKLKEHVRKGQALHHLKDKVVRGAMKLEEEGRVSIHAFESATVGTLVHEMGHVLRRNLQDGELKTVKDWLVGESSRLSKLPREELSKDIAHLFKAEGVVRVVDNKGNFTREGEEIFARGFERYLMGDPPRGASGAVLKAFEKMKEWLTEIYKTVTGNDVEVSPEIRQVFDRYIAGKEQPKVAAKESWQIKRVDVGAKPGQTMEEALEIHRGQVKAAIDRGDDVPVEVLMDYEDLLLDIANKAINRGKGATKDAGKRLNKAARQMRKITDEDVEAPEPKRQRTGYDGLTPEEAFELYQKNVSSLEASFFEKREKIKDKRKQEILSRQFLDERVKLDDEYDLAKEVVDKGAARGRRKRAGNLDIARENVRKALSIIRRASKDKKFSTAAKQLEAVKALKAGEELAVKAGSRERHLLEALKAKYEDQTGELLQTIDSSRVAARTNARRAAYMLTRGILRGEQTLAPGEGRTQLEQAIDLVLSQFGKGADPLDVLQKGVTKGLVQRATMALPERIVAVEKRISDLEIKIDEKATKGLKRQLANQKRKLATLREQAQPIKDQIVVGEGDQGTELGKAIRELRTQEKAANRELGGVEPTVKAVTDQLSDIEGSLDRLAKFAEGMDYDFRLPADIRREIYSAKQAYLNNIEAHRMNYDGAMQAFREAETSRAMLNMTDDEMRVVKRLVKDPSLHDLTAGKEKLLKKARAEKARLAASIARLKDSGKDTSKQEAALDSARRRVDILEDEGMTKDVIQAANLIKAFFDDWLGKLKENGVLDKDFDEEAFFDRVDIAGYIPHVTTVTTRRKIEALRGKGMLPKRGEPGFAKRRKIAGTIDEINAQARVGVAESIAYHLAYRGKWGEEAAEASRLSGDQLKEVLKKNGIEWNKLIDEIKSDAGLDDIFEFFETDPMVLMERYNDSASQLVADNKFIEDILELFPLGRELGDMYGKYADARALSLGYERLSSVEQLQVVMGKKLPPQLRNFESLIKQQLAEGVPLNEIVDDLIAKGVSAELISPDIVQGFAAKQWYVPSSVAEYLRYMNKPDKFLGMAADHKFVQVFDGIQSWMKMMATISASAHLGRNWIGNVISPIQEMGLGALDPESQFAAMMIWGSWSDKHLGKTLEFAGRKMTIEEWREFWQVRGVYDSPVSSEFIRETMGVQGPKEVPTIERLAKQLGGAGAGAALGGVVAGPAGAFIGGLGGAFITAKPFRNRAWTSFVDDISDAVEAGPKQAIPAIGQHVSGVGTGAVIGSAIAPGVGTAIGAAIGGLSFPDYIKMMSGLNQSIEAQARVSMAMSLLKKGETPEAARAAVNRALRNYSDLNPWERSVMRRVFFFYTWDAGNIRFQLRQLRRKPREAKVVASFGNGVYKGQFSEEEINALPEHLRWRVLFRTGATKLVALSGLPHEPAIEILSRGKHGIPTGLVSRIRPDVLTFFEWAMGGGKSTYYGKQWEQINNVRSLKNAPPLLKAMVGFPEDGETLRVPIYKNGRKTGKYRTEYRARNPRLMYLMQRVPGYRVINEYMKIVTDTYQSFAMDQGDDTLAATGSERFWAFAFGQKPTTIDWDGQIQYMAYQLEERLLEIIDNENPRAVKQIKALSPTWTGPAEPVAQ